VFEDLICAVEVVTDYDCNRIEKSMISLTEQGCESIMLLCCDTEQDLTFLNKLLPKFSLPIFGGVYPEVIWQQQSLNTGMLLVGLSTVVSLQLNENISKPQHCKPEIVIKDNSNLLVFVDGLSSGIERCIQALFDWVGSSCTVIGGGAGSLSFQQKPCVITSQGIFTDAMLLVSIEAEMKLAIAHGWQTMAGPFLATKVEDNRIKEINFRPAFEVYCEQILANENVTLTTDNFFQHAKNFPLGIDRLDDDMLVRDPILVEQQDLVCVGTVPENSMLYLLKGDEQTLIDTTVEETSQLPNDNEWLFVVDCISRKLFLQEQFDREISGIRTKLDNHQHFIAVLALGEIATGKFGAINFHNKTSITAAISRFKGSKCNK